MEIQVDIKPTGIESAIVYAPFNKALSELVEKGYKVISLPQNSLLRIQQGPNHDISKNGNWTREGVLYTSKGKPKIVRDSPVLYSAKEATRAHKEGKEFYPTQEQIEQALADSTEFPEKNIEIPTNRFSDEPLTIWAFGGEKEARAYGEFLGEAGIKTMPVYALDKNHVDKQGKPFVRQIWFRDLDGRSDLAGNDWYLGGGGRLRGVKMGAEGTTQNSDAYTSKDITKALNDLGISGGLETQILNKLRR